MTMEDESFTNMPLWGEYDDANQEFPSSWSTNVLNNMEQDVIINSIKPICFKNTFYDNQSCDQNEKKYDDIVLNDIMKHTCKLIKYKNDLKEITESGKLQDTFHLDKPKSDILNKIKREDDTIQFFKHQSSDFVNGIFTQPPLQITNESALKILRSSVCTILAFTGFSTTTMLPLQLLTEVVEDYIKRMMKLLHINIEKEKLEGETGFSDALDRMCHEIGIGSVRNLAQHFREETLVVSNKKIKECEEEIETHEDIVKKLREEKRQASELSFAEMEDEDLVIPELHLTSLSGSEMSSEPFEAGLQMLQTLERQQLMNIDLLSQPSCSSSSVNVSLNSVKSELEDLKPAKRRRK